MPPLENFGLAAHSVQSPLRVDFSKPDIFVVHPAQTAFLEAMHKAERVRHYAGGPDGPDMQTRIGNTPESRGRRETFAWRHPLDPHAALVSVNAAYTTGKPDKIQPVLDAADAVNGKPDTVTFYSISNWKDEVRGIGAPFLAAVCDHIGNKLPHIKDFVTLSPIPNLRQCVENASADVLNFTGIEMAPEKFKGIARDAQSIAELKAHEVYDNLASLGAYFILGGRRQPDGKLRGYDGVAGFHQGRGAVAERLCPEADLSARGFKESFGIMANYAKHGDPEVAAKAYRAGQPIIRPAIAAWLPPMQPDKMHSVLWTAPRPGA